jgi:GNAT superfamily N-acetyltransferase
VSGRRPYPPQNAGTVEFTWTRHIPGIGFVSGLELWAQDGSTDLGWAFAVNDPHHLNVHELYVRPEYRRQGICKFLVRRLEGAAHRGGVVPRYWLSHVDNGALGPDKLDIAYSLGYRVEESGVTWAAKLVVPRTEAYVVRPQSPAFRYGSCAAGCHLAADVIHRARAAPGIPGGASILVPAAPSDDDARTLVAHAISASGQTDQPEAPHITRPVSDREND